MGRTTTPVKQVVNSYVVRLREVADMLDPREREAVLVFLNDLDETASLLSHIGVVDPLEVLITHILRKCGRGCFRSP